MDQAKQAAAAPQLKPNQTMIVGRVDSVRRYEMQGKSVFEHRVIQPAADAFSSPGAVLVSASFKVGSPGEDVRLHCEVTGWRDSYKDRDQNVIQTARNALRVVE